MKTNMLYALGGATLVACMAACSAPRATTTEPSVVVGGRKAPAVECVEFDSTTILRMSDLPSASAMPGHIRPGAQATMPRARVYRMNGNYADNVPVGTDGNGRIISYPAPTDVSAASRPMQLAGGWWLDRRGVGQHTVFTRFTYEEYAALPQSPSVAQLREAIIPGARVTAVEELPWTLREAVTDTAAVNAWLQARTPRRL